MKKLLGVNVRVTRTAGPDEERVSSEELFKLRGQFREDLRVLSVIHDTHQYLLATELHRYWSASPSYILFKAELIAYLKKNRLAETVKLLKNSPTEDYERLLKEQFVGERGPRRALMLRVLSLYLWAFPERQEKFSGVLTAKDRAELPLTL